MKWIDYREKLGIGFNDKQKFEVLKNKISNFMDILRPRITKNSYVNYSMMVGEKAFDSSPGYFLNMSLQESKNLLELIAKYIAFYNAYSEQDDYRASEIKMAILNFLKDSLDELSISFEAIQDNDGVFIFPKGALELDEALVSAPLEWLSKYPTSRTAFVKALKEYTELTPNNASDVADKFRKALEAFFREFFNVQNPLEKCKSIYGNYLKDHGVPKEIANNFESLLASYTNYMNDNAKHQDKADVNVLEYIMYQTGNIIRLLITLKQGEDKNAD